MRAICHQVRVLNKGKSLSTDMHSIHGDWRASSAKGFAELFRGGNNQHLHLWISHFCILSHDYARWKSLTLEASGREAPSFSREGQNTLLVALSLGSEKVRAAVRSGSKPRQASEACHPSIIVNKRDGEICTSFHLLLQWLHSSLPSHCFSDRFN